MTTLRWTTSTNTQRVTLTHDCPVVGAVEVSQDWQFCPWCGCGMVRAIRAAIRAYPRRARLSEGKPQFDAW